MSKTLETIQMIFKIAKILATIAFVFSIVGAVFCLLGFFSTTAVLALPFSVGDVNIHGLIEENSGMATGAIYSALSVGLITCIGQIVISYFAKTYFKHELDAGTPFTFAGAKEMLRLGILSMAIPVACMFLCGIVHGILSVTFGAIGELEMDEAFSVTMGLMFLVMSFILKHGAEIREEKNTVE